MVSLRKNYVHSDISANERMNLNEEIDNLYSNDIELEGLYRDVLRLFTAFQSRYYADNANLIDAIKKGDKSVQDVVEQMIRDFLAAKPSNFDEVVAARLGKANLRDLLQELKNKLDGTDLFQKTKITTDAGIFERLNETATADKPTDLFDYFSKEFKIYQFMGGTTTNPILNAPAKCGNGILFPLLFAKNNSSIGILYDFDNQKVWMSKKNGTNAPGAWKALAFEGAYDDIRNEVTVAKGKYSSLEAAIIAANPIVSSAYFGATGDGTDQTEAMQRALDAAENKKLDIPYGKGTYKISSTLYIPNGCTISVHPRAKFIWAGLPGMFMFTNKNNNPTTGGYDKSRNITVKGGIFDMQNASAYAFGFSHMTDLTIDTKIINVKDKNGVLLNGVKDYDIRIQAEGFSSATDPNYVVALTIATADTDFNNPVAKPFDKTPCINGTVFIKANNIKRGCGENKVVDGVKHSKLNYDCDIKNCVEHVGLFTNIERLRTNAIDMEDVGHGIHCIIANDSIYGIEIYGVRAIRGKSKTSRAIWIQSKRGDTAPQFQAVNIERPKIDDFGAGIITDWGQRITVVAPDITRCWEDGLWCYGTLDFTLNGGYFKENNRNNWDSRADVHIGEYSFTTFRAVVQNAHSRTMRIENVQDTKVVDNVVGPTGVVQIGTNHNCEIDRNLKVGW
ncbi:hypothetical protein ACIGHG_23490 [Bacillus sp. NPDC077411]|uniref:hypothetical protein n=1 Tax=Bacillus sp. NPDC077411 TaxID=3363947 RepID=UPI0037C7E0E2